VINKIIPSNRRALGSTIMAMAVLAGCQTTQIPNASSVLASAVAGVRTSMAIPGAVPLPPMAPSRLVTSVEMLRRQFSGITGVAIKSVDKGWVLSSNGNLRLPQQSVSKLWVAMAALDLRDQGRLRLDDAVTVTRDDLTLFHQPIAAMVKGDGYKTNVGELLQRALTTSDNTANDRLLRFIGGPEAVRLFIKRKALGDIQFGPGERLLQSRTAGLEWRPEFAFGNAFTRARAQLSETTRIAAYQEYIANPPDGAAPLAIATALAKLKKGELLSETSTRYLIETMEASKTGKMRLRGAVPEGWRFGHKTGTGQDLGGHTAGYNDVGVLTAPDGRSYSLAVMIGDTDRPVRDRQLLMQSVVEALVSLHDIG